MKEDDEGRKRTRDAMCCDIAELGVFDEDEIEDVGVKVEKMMSDIAEGVGECLDEEADMDVEEDAWDDVRGGQLPAELVKAARNEEVGFMEGRKCSKCFDATIN